ncbi:hypothetical protein C8R46DRAFT_1286934 [Mycena filopes]|nr:hypothetical protein C8R46DRAFT_1286934 [Mycena filopes]
MTDLTLNAAASTSSIPHRGPKACTNCRRRKIKCDAVRPICTQCRVRPPRSKELCQYPHVEGQSPMDLPAQLLETISVLRNRVEELEYLANPDPGRVYLSQPYSSEGSTPDSHSAFTPIPSITTFLARFAASGYLFLPPAPLRAAALLPLPFGHPARPAPALLSAAYLWGSLLSPVTLNPPYTPRAFLPYVLENIAQALADIDSVGARGGEPRVVLETIQAEVLVSLYYLHSAAPAQGRYHAAAAASLAVGAGLHYLVVGSALSPPPPFVLAVAGHDMELESVRIDAFWAVVTVNNCWVAAEGSPSALSGVLAGNTLWAASSQGGSVFGADDVHASTPTALLAKASILLEQAISFSRSAFEPSSRTTLTSLDAALHTFRAALPPVPPPDAQTQTRAVTVVFPTTQTLVLTHAFVDFAIVRLHAASTADPARRAQCLAAAGRVVAGVGAVCVLHGDGAYNVDPTFGVVYAGVAGVYMREIERAGAGAAPAQRRGSVAAQQRVRTEELRGGLEQLMGPLASLAAYSPLVERCFVDMRAVYAGIAPTG